MMITQTSRTGFPAGLPYGLRIDLVEIATIGIGIVVMTVLAMMF